MLASVPTGSPPDNKIGDEIVAEAARRVAGTLREGDFCGRWGGDEFVVLIADCDGAVLQSAALRILNAIRQEPFAHSDRLKVRLTTSIGAHLLAASDTLESAVSSADVALYAAKSGGRDRISLSAPQVLHPGGAKVA